MTHLSVVSQLLPKPSQLPPTSEIFQLQLPQEARACLSVSLFYGLTRDSIDPEAKLLFGCQKVAISTLSNITHICWECQTGSSGIKLGQTQRGLNMTCNAATPFLMSQEPGMCPQTAAKLIGQLVLFSYNLRLTIKMSPTNVFKTDHSALSFPPQSLFFNFLET